MTRIGICGVRGRMGRALLRVAGARADVTIVGGIGREQSEIDSVPVVTIEQAGTLMGDVDVLVDFSSPTATAGVAGHLQHTKNACALVVGTTGLDDDVQNQLDALASRTAVLVAANFSLGVNLLLALTARVAAALTADTFDIEIIEAHHRRKADAPSGTALALGAAAAQGRGARLDQLRRDGRTGAVGARRKGEIGMHAVRGGGITGEHRVLFAAEQEVIELRHEALDRDVFAYGALEAAQWIAGRSPGRYTMQHVLGL